MAKVLTGSARNYKSETSVSLYHAKLANDTLIESNDWEVRRDWVSPLYRRSMTVTRLTYYGWQSGENFPREGHWYLRVPNWNWQGSVEEAERLHWALKERFIFEKKLSILYFKAAKIILACNFTAVRSVDTPAIFPLACIHLEASEIWAKSMHVVIKLFMRIYYGILSLSASLSSSHV